MTATLFDETPFLVETTDGETIQERFDAWIAANPFVVTALERLTRQWLDHGHSRVGMKMLVERLRWEFGIATKGDAFRLNNTWTSRLARLLIARHPEWADAFETRELRAA